MFSSTRIFGFLTCLTLVVVSSCTMGENSWAPVDMDDTRTDSTVACDPDSYGSCVESNGFNCVFDDAGNKLCTTTGSQTPDDGSWFCELVINTLHCVGDHLPEDSEWICWEEGSQVVCESDFSYPDGGSSETYECDYSGDMIVCEPNGTDDTVVDTPDNPDNIETHNCPPNVGSPSEELCDDGLDNDCDGFVDEDCGDDTHTTTDPPHDGSSTCAPWLETTVRFGDSGELVALDRDGDYVDCTTVEVDITGYYAFYDDRIAESCSTQVDETGFLTVTNSCNTSGSPEETNVANYYVVEDVDNTSSCSNDSECGDGMACREGNAGYCCVPELPVYMGTFLLVAGERNELCINHWCPVWRDRGRDDGFVNDNCDGSIDSIHVSLDGSMRVCLDDHTVPSCG